MTPVQSSGLRLIIKAVMGARRSSLAAFLHVATAIMATCAGSLTILHLPM